MDSSLQQSLSRFIDSASVVAYEQAPQAIHQMVAWHAVLHTAGLVVSLLLLFFITRFFIKTFDDGYNKEHAALLKRDPDTTIVYTNNFFKRISQRIHVSSDILPLLAVIFFSVLLIGLASGSVIYNISVLVKIIFFPNWYVVGQSLELLKDLRSMR